MVDAGSAPVPVGEWLEQIAAIEPASTRLELVDRSPAMQRVSTVEAVHEQVLRILYTDPVKAERLAEAGAWIASYLTDDAAEALSARCTANVAFFRGDHEEALVQYRHALALFERLDRDAETGRTLNSGLQSLIYLGRYPEALEWAQRARELFMKTGDSLRLARLASNTGNIFYRQDQYDEALVHYEEAREGLERMGEPRDVAAVLSNIAVCVTGLGRFDEAVQRYREARDYCSRHGLLVLVAASDYNIAWLHYLRGDYTDALKLYAATRQHCELAGDAYHLALCDLDESEIQLDLNLTRQAEELAHRAAARFEELGMGYERGKALVNEALAQGRQGRLTTAVQSFGVAREIFRQEGNPAWPAVIQLYEAAVCFRQGRLADAERLAQSSWNVLSASALRAKAALCRLLQARLQLEMNHPAEALAICGEALADLDRAGPPSLRFHANALLGGAHEQLGSFDDAYRTYQAARAQLEDLRNRLGTEDLKVAILQDKSEVYESLVHLLLEGLVKSSDPEREAFGLIQEAKSRSLAEGIPAGGEARPGVREDGRQIATKKELNRHYRELEWAVLHRSGAGANRIQEIERQIAERERSLARASSEARLLEETGPAADALPFESLRESIAPDATLLEYFAARGALYVCLLTKGDFRIERLSSTSRTRDAQRLFQYQIEKFRLGAEYLRTFAGPLLDAVKAHLRALYEELIAPIRGLLRTKHLVIAPHGELHQLPFHALHDGESYLVDQFTISTTPSAGVYARCAALPPNTDGGALVAGCLHPRAPRIEEEARAIAGMLQASRLLLGAEASEAKLREYAPTCRYLHIASHGVFRRDNPAYSAVDLGDSHLALQDLGGIPLSAELVTLSGCSTGKNVVMRGDELIGLMRGLLQAGARSVLLSLWDVHDGSATEFMTAFYRGLQSGRGKAEAWRCATLELRERYPHPWHWAPFTLIGQYQ